MINILLSVVASVLVTLFFGWIFGQGSVRILFGIVPGLIALFVVFFLLSRRINRGLQELMVRVQQVMTPSNPQRQQNREAVRRRIDEAIALLESGMKWRWWQPFVAGQLRGQIGRLYYLDQRYDEAQPWLSRAFVRDWNAWAMLAAIHYRKKKTDEMKKAFEVAAKAGKKESLLWNMYAWCHLQLGNRDEAIDVLNRGRAAVPGDERTKRNLESVQNGKKMKMKGWEMMWYQFHLEKPPEQQAMRPRMDRRSVFRGR